MGELFPAESIRKVLTVSELTGSVRRLLEKEFRDVWVTGEITNLRVQSSGHVYFTIKDLNAQLSCVLFKSEARTVNREFLADGQKVVLQGELTVYEARGQYQLRITSIQLQGIGALQAQFERLKQKLQAEGLFDNSRKRPLPRFPQSIGLVTSPEGAAIRDVLHAIQRRDPSLEVVLAPCRVQGIGAAQEIASAVQLLNDFGSRPNTKLDLILVTRGGGSLEDLWAFNEEVVARAVYNSRLPVVSAIGHEIDFTICDFTADIRAATPTAGAELITEGFFSRREYLREMPAHLAELASGQLERKRERLAGELRLLARGHPRRRLQQQMQRIDELHEGLARCARKQFRQWQAETQDVIQRFVLAQPALLLQKRHERLALLHDRLVAEMRYRLAKAHERATHADTRLRLLAPKNILNRGYSITLSAETGEVIRDATQLARGQLLRTQLKSGEVISEVKGEPLP